MTDRLKQFSERLKASHSATKQEALAEEIAQYCQQQPTAIGADTEYIFDALVATDGQTRAILSESLFDLGQKDREAVGHIAMPVLSYLIQEDQPPQVRIWLGRVLGDAVAGDPWTLPSDASSSLVMLLDDDERWFRHSIAWALELLAHTRPSALSSYTETLYSHTDDPHPQVAKHISRALAHLERYQHQIDQATFRQIADNLYSTDTSLRTAASICLGAIGTPAAIETLTSRYSLEDDPDIRSHLRQALREATFPEHFESGEPVDIATVASGDWLAIRTQHSVTRTPRYRGVVREIDTTIGPTSSTWIQLVNPYEGYTVSVTADGDDWLGTYSDQRTSDAKAITVTESYQLDANRVALLYALEGDTIEFDLDGPTYEITVADVDSNRKGRRVWGTDDSGNTVEFRPCRHDPILACYDEGRCFETTTVDLDPADGPPDDPL